MSVLRTCEQLLRLSNYGYSIGRWWNKTNTDPKDLIDHNILLGSDGTWHLEYCTTCEEWGHNSCNFEEAWEPISPDYYDPFDDDDD
jgi:hypothetical protein